MAWSLVILAVYAALAVAQDAGIIDTLRGQAQLSSFTAYVSRSQDFVSWLEGLDNVTILAPNNQAFEQFPIPADSEQDALEAFLTYHVLQGRYEDFGDGEFRSIPSHLEPSAYANVTGGQIVVAQGSTLSNATRFFSGLRSQSSMVGNPIPFASGIIHVLDRPLTLPQSFTATAARRELLSAQVFADARMEVSASQTTLTLDQVSDVTVFLPMNNSIQEIGSVIESMTRAELDRVIAYHTVDQRLDINLLAPPSGTYNTLEGSELSIFSSNGYTFINSARIVSSASWLFSGGSIYVIDGVLNPDNRTVAQNLLDSEAAFGGATEVDDVAFPAPATEDTPNGSGLSTAAKIGIGVAAGVVGLILATLAGFFLLRRYRNRSHNQPLARPEYQMSEFTPSQKDLVRHAAAPGISRDV